jgi:hypothetical protein
MPASYNERATKPDLNERRGVGRTITPLAVPRAGATLLE